MFYTMLSIKLWCQEHIFTCKKTWGCRNTPSLKKDKYGNYFVHDPFLLQSSIRGEKKNRGAESSPLSLCLTNNLLNSPSNPGQKFMKQSFQEASSSPTTTLHTCVTHGQVESHQQVTKQGLFLPSVASAMKQSFSKSSTTHVPLNAKISILC